MLAFVLSGGGTKGAAQAGALRALLEAGITPEMLVGCSAGAVNATYLAVDPSPAQAQALEALWRQVTPHILGGHPPQAAWRALRGEPSFFPNDNIKRYLLEHGPHSARRFSNLRIPLYLVAAKLRTGEPVVFGDDPQERVLRGVLASMAFPPVLEPVLYNGEWLIDGGVASVLPLRIAIERGATTIYAFNLTGTIPEVPNPPNVLIVSELSLDAVFRRQVEEEIAWAARQPGITLHIINLEIERGISMWDFSHMDELLGLGYETARRYLDSPHPIRRPRHPLVELLGRFIARLCRRAATG